MRLALLSLTALALIACDDASPADAGAPPDATATIDAAPSDAGAAPAGWGFETIDERTVAVDDRTVPVELVRATRPDGGASYLLYFPAPAPGAALAVMTEPYSGVDWTGDATDARWATRGAGLHDDDDAPDWDGDDVIAYEVQSLEDAASGSNLFLLHGVAVVRPYGRFYAGGDLADDVMDSVAPYHFALSRGAAIDPTRIGAYGSSWGGFMALYGAARAPNGAAPRSVVAVAPPSDFADMWTWASELPDVFPDPGEAERFFSPYLRRIEAGAGGPPASGDYGPFSWATLCAELRGPVLIPHDQWDVLVPVRQTEGFAAACPDRVRPLYWPRQAPTDYATVGMSHGPFDGVDGVPTVLSLPLTHLLLELTDGADVLTIVDDAPLAAWLGLIRAEQAAGGEPGYALAPLRELADPRVTAYRPDGTSRSGATAVATAINAVWGTSYDQAGVRAALDDGLPTP